MHLRPKRRWVRFSTRTLLIAITIVCVWLGWQWRIVHERKVVRQLVTNHGGSLRGQYVLAGSLAGPWAFAPAPPVSWIRAQLGDEAVVSIAVPSTITSELIVRIETAFPEAILRLKPAEELDEAATKSAARKE